MVCSFTSRIALFFRMSGCNSGWKPVPEKFFIQRSGKIKSSRRLQIAAHSTTHATTHADGSLRVISTQAFGAYSSRLTDRLLRFADPTPKHTLAAMHYQGGDWVRISDAQALRSARSIAQWLIHSGASAKRPVAILAGNDIEHLLPALGAMLTGVPLFPSQRRTSPCRKTSASCVTQLKC